MGVNYTLTTITSEDSPDNENNNTFCSIICQVVPERLTGDELSAGADGGAGRDGTEMLVFSLRHILAMSHRGCGIGQLANSTDWPIPCRPSVVCAIHLLAAALFFPFAYFFKFPESESYALL